MTGFGHIDSHQPKGVIVLEVHYSTTSTRPSDKIEGYHVDHVPYQEPRPANPGVGDSNLVIPAYQAPYPPPSIDFLIISLGVFCLPSSRIIFLENSYPDQ